MTVLRTRHVARQSLRIVLMARDIELRIVSLVVRAREGADEVILLDLGSNDSTVEYAQEIGCEVLHFTNEVNVQNIASFLLDSNLEQIDSTLVLSITDQWKLRDLPISINRSLEEWDVHLSHQVADGQTDTVDDLILGSVTVHHIVFTQDGLEAVAYLGPLARTADLDQQLRVRIVEARVNVGVPQRESLATASRFAQLFYWMLETKHPLLLFGIPGVVLFILGYKLSGNVVGALEELNTTSIGVTLATIAMTLVGLFGIMVALFSTSWVSKLNRYNLNTTGHLEAHNNRLILEGVSGLIIMSQKGVARLVCLDMDRVLVDHLSTWQFVYDNLGISNDESFELYNQGLLDEWDWIKLDIALIRKADHPARLRFQIPIYEPVWKECQ